MLVQDSADVSRLKREARETAHLMQIIGWVNDLEKNTVYVEPGGKNDHSDMMAQMGKPLMSAEFERKLKKILPKMVFEDSPEPGYRAAYFVTPEGNKVLLSAYQRGVMPEHSVVEAYYEDVPDYSLLRGRKVQVPDYFGNPTTISGQALHVDRKDFPKGELVPEDNALGVAWKSHSSGPLPGWKRIRHAGHEVLRGWRTCLLKAVLLQWISPMLVEKEFGVDNTPEWKGQLGRGETNYLGAA